MFKKSIIESPFYLYKISGGETYILALKSISVTHFIIHFPNLFRIGAKALGTKVSFYAYTIQKKHFKILIFINFQ